MLLFHLSASIWGFMGGHIQLKDKRHSSNGIDDGFNLNKLQPTCPVPLAANEVVLPCERLAEAGFEVLMFNLDCFLSNEDKKGGDRINSALPLDTGITVSAQLINTLRTNQPVRDSHIFNAEKLSPRYKTKHVSFLFFFFLRLR